AQSPSFRKRRWNQALKYIADRISENVPTEKPRDFDELDAADDFVYSINHYIESLALERITIVID
ncbi:hypothetical protein, partial [Metapseudomonas otitidis]